MTTSAKYPAALLALSDVGGEMANFPEAVLSGAHNNSVTTITLTATAPAAWPTVGSVTIDSEIIAYTGKSGSTLTGCTRASQSTTAASHSDLAKVGLYLTAAQWNQVVADLIATQTKIGTGASTPSGTTNVLTATGTGTSAWAAPATINGNGITYTYTSWNTAFSTTSATMVDITSASIAVTTSHASNPVRYALGNYLTTMSTTAMVNFRIYNSTDAAELALAQAGGVATSNFPTQLVATVTQATAAKTVKGQMLSDGSNTAKWNGGGETQGGHLDAQEVRSSG